MNGNWMELAHNVEIQRFLCTGTLHFQLEAGTHLSAKHLADFLVVLSGKVFSVNFHQNISGFQAYIGSRRISRMAQISWNVSVSDSK